MASWLGRLVGRRSSPAEEMAPGARLPGLRIALDEHAHLALLAELRSDAFGSLFARLRHDPLVNPGFRGIDYRARDLIHNGYFPTPDAELYAAMIVRERPARVLEVGGGYSTLVARAAIEHGGLECALHVVDPEPRRPVEKVADRVERAPVQRSSLTDELPGADTIVFIDSSHRMERGGDGPFLYEHLLPSLPTGVLVHVHDVFLPYAYPPIYRRWGYAEQEALYELLVGDRAPEVVFAAHYMSRTHPEAMAETFGAAVADDPLFGGASFWMRTR